MSKKGPLLSVMLPTFNGASTVERALQSVKAQTYKNYEIIVVDHHSTDGTVKIAKKYTNKIYLDKRKLLSSRKIALEKSKGELIIFLSCDQVFEPTFFERAAKLFQEGDYDMAVTEERSFKPVTWIEKLTDIDRRRIQEAFELDPQKSVLLPGVFRKSLLLKVFKKFSTPLLEHVTIHDHAIIYYECYKLSHKIGVIPNAVYHEEPKTTKELFSHYYGWGKRSRAVNGILGKEYEQMFANKMSHRLKTIRIFNRDDLAIMPIVFIKGLGFKLGYYFG